VLEIEGRWPWGQELLPTSVLREADQAPP
jgi:hypothetical protein